MPCDSWTTARTGVPAAGTHHFRGMAWPSGEARVSVWKGMCHLTIPRLRSADRAPSLLVPRQISWQTGGSIHSVTPRRVAKSRPVAGNRARLFMKIWHKILVAPAVAILFLLAFGALAWLVLH